MNRKKETNCKNRNWLKDQTLPKNTNLKTTQAEEQFHINHLLKCTICKKQPAPASILAYPREKYSESLNMPSSSSLQNRNAQLKMELSKYKLQCQKLKIKKNDYKWLLQEVYSLILDIYKEFKIYLSHSKLLRMKEALTFMKKLLNHKANIFNQNHQHQQKLQLNTFFNTCQQTSQDEVFNKPTTDNVYSNQHTKILLKDFTNWDEIKTNMHSERVQQSYKQLKEKKRKIKKMSNTINLQETQKIMNNFKLQTKQSIEKIVNRSIQQFYQSIKPLQVNNQNLKQQIKNILKEVKQIKYEDKQNYAKLMTYKLNNVLNGLSQHLTNKSQNNKNIMILKQMKDKLAIPNNKKKNLHQTLLMQVDALQKIIVEQF